MGRPTDEPKSFNGSWAFAILLLTICLIGGAGLRTIGSPFLALVILITAAYAGRRLLSPQNLPALLLTGWGLFYLALSFLNVLPDAWTRHHEPEIIIQQASFVFLLLPVVAASQKWWEDRGFDKHRDAVLITAVIFVFITSTPVSLYVHNEMASFLEFPKPFVTFQNDVMIGLIAITYLALIRMNPLAGTILLIVVFILSVLIEFRFQNVIAYFVAVVSALFVTMRIPLERTQANLVIAGVIGLGLYGMFDPSALFVLDPNTGWRVIFWRDATEAVVKTWGLGVGFGTEALRNEYSMVVGRAFFLPEEDTSFMLIGTHNAFFDVFFRLGIVGIVLWVFIVVRAYPGAHMPPRIRAHAAVVFFAMFICVYSNVALQSPLYAIGVAFAIGYLQSLTRAADLAVSPLPDLAPRRITFTAVPGRTPAVGATSS